MIAQYQTLRFTASGTIRCRACGVGSTLQAGALVTILRINRGTGTTVTNWSPSGLIHDCQVRREWRCVNCDSTKLVERRSYMNRNSKPRKWCTLCNREAEYLPVRPPKPVRR